MNFFDIFYPAGPLPVENFVMECKVCVPIEVGRSYGGITSPGEKTPVAIAGNGWCRFGERTCDPSLRASSFLL